jgi:hypothetical protein
MWQLPSCLLCALAYAFCFSFTGIGPPLLWPLVWLGLVLLVMFNPIRVSVFDLASVILETKADPGYLCRVSCGVALVGGQLRT